MTHRVGRITLAAAFIGVGLGILVDNLYQTGLFWFIVRLWPGLLILLGLEWLWAAARSHESDRDQRVETDGGAIFLLIVVAIVAAGASAAHNAAGRWFQFTPRVSVNAVAPPRVDINIPTIPAITFGNVPAEVTLAQELKTDDLEELLVSSSSAAITVEDGPTARVELRVRAWAGSQQEAENLARSTQLKVEADGGKVTVRGLRSNSSGRYEDEFRITLPRELAVKLKLDTSSGAVRVTGQQGDVTVQTSSGAVRVDGVEGDVDVRTSSGAITAVNLGGKLAATASSGAIEVSGVKGEVKANSTSGLVTVEWPNDKVSAQTSSGSIALATDRVGGDYDLNAVSGSVRLSLPAGGDFRLTARASSGSVSGPGWLTIGEGRNSGSGTRGDGEYQISVRTNSGSIAVDER